MPELPEPTALYRLYSTKRSDGLPTAIDDLYPQYLDSLHYMGTADSCPDGGPGLSYGMWDFEGATLVRVIKWGVPETPIPTALYRLRDQVGELLYVGITDNPERRWKDHAKDKPWWPLVADRSMEWLPSRDRALAAERDAIRAEKPGHNVVHNTERANPAPS